MAETVEASQRGASRGKNRLAIIAALACVVVGATFGYNAYGANDSTMEGVVYEEQQMASTVVDAGSPSINRRRLSGVERLLESEPEPEDEDTTKEQVLIEKIAKKLEPVDIRFNIDEEVKDALETGEFETRKKGEEEVEDKATMVPHQFLHLHHMKTGGTSIDRLLRCSMDRLKKEANYNVPYFTIHECSRNRFAQCLTDPENTCRAKMEIASVLSYCAALKYLDEFGWWNDGNRDNQIKAFTVLRHPVDRVWSMFRFQTKNCYKCQPLKDIYEKLEAGEDTGVDKLCLAQLQNHEVNNLLSTEWPLEVTELDFENNIEHLDMSSKMVQEAVDNMKGFFTIIGITERLPETAELLGKTFPWMNLEPSKEYETTSQCELPHANASPKNNRCGEDGKSHWDLPKQPDQETYDLIMKHNALDMELYESAVAYFELQVKALESAE
mmetsp:Transcript_14479/g.36368  ORF Transcript_14479/g.36368 Transcript_14479/m.36368 type:complete len:441 (+) Transcript_14479:163-1485(+)